MQKTISSKMTFAMKFVYPLLCGFSLLYFVWKVYFFTPQSNSFPIALFVLFIVGILIFILAINLRLKKITVFDDFLYVSNYQKEIKIPLTDIEKITENVVLNHHPVTIHLKNASEFGKKIIFIPTFRVFSFYSSHPTAIELKELVKSKRAELNSYYSY